jgi:hypothetical protein
LESFGFFRSFESFLAGVADIAVEVGRRHRRREDEIGSTAGWCCG